MPEGAVPREEFARLLRDRLGEAGMTQATLVRRLRRHGIRGVSEPRVSDWIHGRYLPRDEAVVLAIEAVLGGDGEGDGGLVARYWAARQAPKPPSPPPGASAAREAGPGPAVTNLPPRNPNFTGREGLLGAVERALHAGGATAVVAAHGLGGVGKSQLALEYAHRNLDRYELVWWLPAESPLLVATGLAALAARLGVAAGGAAQEEQVGAVLAALGRRGGWLLVYDNAERPEDLAGLRPAAGGGDVLITSRNPAWRGIGTPLAVDVLTRREAVAFLLRRTGGGTRSAAGELAAELGGLPLALEQAAAYADQNGLTLGEYLASYRRHRSRLLARGSPLDHPATVATTWRLNVEQVTAANPAAAELLRLCAFLAPEATPLDLFTAGAAGLPPALAAACADELARDELLGILYRYSLVARDRQGLRMHRLVQTAVRATLEPGQAAGLAADALRLVRAAFPDQPQRPETWARCGALLPHADAVARHAADHGVALDAAGALLRKVGVYLWHRAELDAAREHLERAVAAATAAYGPDHPEVGSALGNLGAVLASLGDTAGSRALHERDVAIKEAALGPDHPGVGFALSNLGEALRRLGDPAAAEGRLHRALAILEGAFGPDDPEVATVLTVLGTVLHELGDLDGAHARLERAAALGERAYGPDDPEVAMALAIDGAVLRDLGEQAAARARLERALAVLRATLGDAHPDTERAADLLRGLERPG